MKAKLQTLETKTTEETNSLPFESELNSFIEKAKEHGVTKTQAINYLRKYWDSSLVCLQLPEENEAERKFREKVKKFMDAKYEEFDSFAYKYSFPYNGSWHWSKLDKATDTETKRGFIYEVAGSIYKAFEMDSFDREQLKKITLERTKFLFPNLKGQVRLFYLVLSELLGYAGHYKVDKKCDSFLEQFELETYYDICVCKFVWLVENF